MGYYQDVDEARGMDELAEQELRELDRQRVQRARNFNQAVKAQVAKELAKHGVKQKISKPRGATVQVKCKNCKNDFVARTADRKRGWAKFCSKSCKAQHQTRTRGY
jgi:hypothetical protein